VFDFYGLTEEEVRSRAPDGYQWVFDRVREERLQNNRPVYRDRWWVFAEPRAMFRNAAKGLQRIVITPRTAKHRFFLFDRADVQFESEIVGFAVEDSLCLGVLSSGVHMAWVQATAASFGAYVGNIRYNQTVCFDPFPFPTGNDEQAARIRSLAEHLDTHRKRQQAQHPGLTLTGMYNVLDKLRSGEPFTAKERTIHEQGLVSVLRQLHDDLDAAVLNAYGWSDLLPLLRVSHGNDSPAEGQTRDDAKRAFDESILERLVALNAERAAEEARGHIRWLRPEFQNPQATPAPQQAELDTGSEDDSPPPLAGEGGAQRRERGAPDKPIPWPKDAIEQVRAVADLLSASAVPLSIEDIGNRFTARGPWKKRLPQLVEMLVALGRAEMREGGVVGF
jgi:hypothetical protein